MSLRHAALLTAAVISLTSVHAHAADATASSPRPWLAHPASASVSSAGGGVARVAVFLGLVGLLGGAGVWARRRWKGPQASPAQPRLRVIDSIRLADKAQLVLVDVGGRNLLLGITPRSVRRLGWVRDAEEGSATDTETSVDDRADRADRADRDGFPSLLRQAFGAGTTAAPVLASDADPATVLAARAEDVVEPFTRTATSPTAALVRSRGGRKVGGSAAKEPVLKVSGSDVDDPSPVEAQASGLRKRRR